MGGGSDGVAGEVRNGLCRLERAVQALVLELPLALLFGFGATPDEGEVELERGKCGPWWKSGWVGLRKLKPCRGGCAAADAAAGDVLPMAAKGAAGPLSPNWTGLRMSRRWSLSGLSALRSSSYSRMAGGLWRTVE